MQPISLSEKFALINEHWRPKVVASRNGQEVKLVKFCGTFPWHTHAKEDELFLVWHGTMTVEFRDRIVNLSAGEMCLVPRVSNIEPLPPAKLRSLFSNQTIR